MNQALAAPILCLFWLYFFSFLRPARGGGQEATPASHSTSIPASQISHCFKSINSVSNQKVVPRVRTDWVQH